MTLAAVRALIGLFAALLASSVGRSTAASPSPFADWAAVVVAADWRASNGKPTAAFENTRRDVSAALLTAGFRPENLRTLGVDAPAPVAETTPQNLVEGVMGLASRTRGGCLLYFTSHGSPQGIAFGRGADGRATLPPGVLARLLNDSCGQRPTVVFVSACFSGVYVPALAAPNRMIMTAARPDRSSFGCGEDDTYPFFDACVLESLPRAADFLALSRTVRACVARREKELKLSPASEPQVSVGARIAPLLPLLRLSTR